ncbi:gastrin-releasing peptide [Myripristis murdjan]|uniref:gastrin-releasing peptide n=1 Tax=Myripristis murdjan TaxID=586833 RepID=UPI001175D4F3|nr:gastrin-releasing peptide [Myripristis murdjan]
MGEVCTCSSWICRQVLPAVLILAAVAGAVRCSDSPAAVGGKMYPRGNHWAVGHLMGKKSIESLPGLHDSNRDYLPPLERGGNDVLHRYELMPAVFRALSHLRSHSRTLHTADRLHVLRSRGVEEDRDKCLREMSELLLLVLNLRDSGSS